MAVEKPDFKMLDGVKEVATYSDDDIIIFNDIRKLALSNVSLHTIVSDTNVILYCACGTISLDVNDVSYTLTDRQILICPPMANLCNYHLSEDCYCHGLSISSNILNGALKNNISIWNKCLYVDKVNVLKLDDQGEELWYRYYDLLATKFMKPIPNCYNEVIVQNIIYAVVLELCGRMVENASDLLKRRLTEHTKQSSVIFRNYLDLLNNTPVKYHPVEYYASQLFVTPKYLANVCKQESGKSAITWIQESVVHDIQYLLSKPDVTIKEIARLTGFGTLSLFGRFVRTYMGISPRNLRKKV